MMSCQGLSLMHTRFNRDEHNTERGRKQEREKEGGSKNKVLVLKQISIKMMWLKPCVIDNTAAPRPVLLL